MSARPIVTRAKPLQMARDRLTRSLALGYASKAVKGLQDALPANNEELRVEALRATIRLCSKLIDDPMRAAGILGGAASDLTPAWTDGKTGRAQAEALFKADKP